MSSRLVFGGLLGLFLSLQAGVALTQDLPGVDRGDVTVALAAPGAREAIARVALAEAANQGDSGLLAVVYTILNRLADGRWGHSVDEVLNARAQFEPVLRAGGDWRALPPVSAVQRTKTDTLINLVLEGRVPDLTGGALYFQNPAIVAARAAAGQVSPRLVHFGGAAPSAVIGDHAFYPGAGRAARASPPAAPPPDAIFVAGPAAGETDVTGPRALFVPPDRARSLR